MMQIGKANGRGKCNKCRRALTKGEPVAIIRNCWGSERFCRECIAQAHIDMTAKACD